LRPALGFFLFGTGFHGSERVGLGEIGKDGFSDQVIADGEAVVAGEFRSAAHQVVEARQFEQAPQRAQCS
jgi:hypothetical protein